MDYLSELKKLKEQLANSNNDFILFQYTDILYVGYDSQHILSVICKSKHPNRNAFRQRTQRLSLECNRHVRFTVDGENHNDVVHIIRAYTETDKESDIFLELCPLFVSASKSENQEQALVELMAILSSFFKDRKEPSMIELQGLYAELYTILYLHDVLDVADYWHSADKMKFDFSISDRLKLEVKSTLKNERLHHFRHEQLINNGLTIFVFSYMLRTDDSGLSLYDLIQKTKPLLSDPRKLLIVSKYEKNTSEEILKALRYSEIYTRQNLKICRAKDIPQFNQITPEGVSNAEYDCNLVKVPEIALNELVELIKTEISYDNPNN